jgi:branched-chain amino acid transport system substrate-binding protein
MTKRRWVMIGVLAFVMVFIGTGARGAFCQDTIKIGVFAPMSGSHANTGQHVQEAVNVVVQDVNSTGGVLGKKLEILYGDDAAKPDEAVNVVTRFISKDNVLLTMGSVTSPCSFAASQVTRRSEVPQIIISGTAARITKQGNPWIFRSPVPDTKLVSDLVDFIHEKFPKVTKFAFLHVNDDFGKGGYDAFVLAGKKYGYEVVVYEKYSRGDLDFTAQLGRIKGSSAQALVEWSRYHEGALIRKQMQALGMKMPHFGSDGHASPDKLIELGQDAINGLYYANHWSPATSSHIPAAQEFIKKMKSKYPRDPDYIDAEAYDGINLYVLAMKRAGSLDRAKIRDSLHAIEYKSVRGDFKFDKDGDPLLQTHVIKIVNLKEANGRTEPTDF